MSGYGLTYESITCYPCFTSSNEPLGAKGPLVVGEEVRKEVGKVGS